MWYAPFLFLLWNMRMARRAWPPLFMALPIMNWQKESVQEH